MKLISITKLEVAVSQLRLAINLFLERRELVATITLAGAAEEILGKLAELDGHTPALTRSIDDARGLHRKLWGTDPGEKSFANLKNKTRNELKHLVAGTPVEIDLEEEAIRILNRAVENYRLLHVRAATFVREYEREREKVRRERNAA